MFSPDAARVFIGRVAELAQLRGLVDKLAAGQGGAVVVEGEPGAGKSALLEAGLGAAEALGCQILHAASDELSRRMPLRTMLDCLAVEPRSPDRRRADIAAQLGGANAPGAIAELAALGPGGAYGNGEPAGAG